MPKLVRLIVSWREDAIILRCDFDGHSANSFRLKIQIHPFLPDLLQAGERTHFTHTV